MGKARWFLAFTPNTEINILAAQIAHYTFNVPEILVLSTRDQDETLHGMLSDIGARRVENDLVNLTAWDQKHRNQEKAGDSVEIEVDEAQSASDFLAQMHEQSELFLPLTVKREEHIMPFFAVKDLQLGDKVMIRKA